MHTNPSPHSRSETVRDDANPQVSVTLPVCNNERFIGDAVRRPLSQACPPFEIVIGEDGSDIGTPAILAELARADPMIRLLRRDRRSGVANAANWVVENTRCELVALLHADDLCHPDRLVRPLAVMAQNPEAVFVGGPAIGISRESDGALGEPVAACPAERLRSVRSFLDDVPA